MKENGIDLYRQDFNIDPLFFWYGGDSENRQGITENFYVQGYLAYFDELLRRHPDMIIDSCASGGRRNDLETMRRAVPFVRSDYIFEPTGQQGHMYGISQWLPYQGTGPSPASIDITMYNLRSTMSPHMVMGFDMRDPNLNYDLLRTWTKQWRAAASYYAGDYYPLTDYSIADNAIIAWQFDRPDLGEGMVQAFRRPNCPVEKCSFPINGIDISRQYEICDLDINKSVIVSGQELAQKGIGVSFNGKPAAVVVTYRAIKTPK
ncbi:MAG: alpha-galactosidase, partial [Sedimentisphaerales bacterium]|nr:alpha-galactosidase [Sedimentisphaerales bacterium]